MNPQPPAVGKLQLVKATDVSVDKSAEHIMPGLIPQIVDSFRQPRKHLTIRGVQRRKKVKAPVITSGLFHNLFDRVEAIERIIARKPVQSEVMVRGFKVMSGGRTA